MNYNNSNMNNYYNLPSFNPNLSNNYNNNANENYIIKNILFQALSLKHINFFLFLKTHTFCLKFKF